MRTKFDNRSLTSVSHRFATIRRIHPRLTSLKRTTYCKRHVTKKIGDDCAYSQFLRELKAFLLCTYAEHVPPLQSVDGFIESLDGLILELEAVHKGVLSAVRGKFIRDVGGAAIRLRKALRGERIYSDCRDDWRKFGLLYQYLF